MKLKIANFDDRHWVRDRNRYILQFGAYGSVRLMVFANHLEEALDIAIDWLAENAPGLIANDQRDEAFAEAISEGKTEEEAWIYAEEDLTIGGNCGDCIISHEWAIVAENPTREQINSLK
jgi:hypothetical protein